MTQHDRITKKAKVTIAGKSYLVWVESDGTRRINGMTADEWAKQASKEELYEMFTKNELVKNGLVTTAIYRENIDGDAAKLK